MVCRPCTEPVRNRLTSPLLTQTSAAAAAAAARKQPLASSAGTRTHDLMPAYYRQFFPFDEFMAWLAYGNGAT
jgi:hypothetical protein